MEAKLSKAEQSARTRAALITAAKELFTEQGYAHTSTEAIVERAGVTRGALYYQFEDKAALFQAVYDEVRHARFRAIRERIETAEGDTWHRLVRASIQAFIDTASILSVQRILYIDGPAVLSVDVWHNQTPGITLTKNGLEQLAAEGLIEDEQLEALAHLLWGALLEAGFYIVNADNEDVAKKQVAYGLERLIAGLRVEPRRPKRARKSPPQRRLG